MPSVGFEPTISVVERPKTYALDRAATETGKISASSWFCYKNVNTMHGHMNVKCVHFFIITVMF